MKKKKLKKNDNVVVISGRDRGAKGRILRMLPGRDAAIVEGVNMMKRHTRPNPQKQVQGGVVEKEAPIRLSKLMLVCPESGQVSRIGRQRLEDGSAARLSRQAWPSKS